MGAPPPSFCPKSAPVDLGSEIVPMRKMPHMGDPASSTFWSTSSGAEIGLWATFSRSDIANNGGTERTKNQKLPGGLEHPFRPVLTTLGEHNVDWDGRQVLA